MNYIAVRGHGDPKQESMNIWNLSKRSRVRLLTEDDIPAIYDLCRENPLYYQYCPPFVTEEGIRQDMKTLPPGKAPEDKYYIGYFDDGKLLAVMDFIAGYPEDDIAFIGFFMMRKSMQGKGLGRAVIDAMSENLSAQGFRAVRLGWVQGNPQAEHFWHKCGFKETGVIAKTEAYTIVIAQRMTKHDEMLEPEKSFTPPYETKESLEERPEEMYRKVQVRSVNAEGILRCRK